MFMLFDLIWFDFWGRNFGKVESDYEVLDWAGLCKVLLPHRQTSNKTPCPYNNFDRSTFI